MQNFMLAIVRIITGLAFFTFGFSKVFIADAAGKKFVDTFPGFVQNALTTGHPYGFWRPFLEHVVTPNAQLFAWSVSIGEMVLGLCLVLGIFSRIASFFGILMMLSIHFCSNPFATNDPFAMKVGIFMQQGTYILLLMVFMSKDSAKSLSVSGFRKMMKSSKSSEKEKANA